MAERSELSSGDAGVFWFFLALVVLSIASLTGVGLARICRLWGRRARSIEQTSQGVLAAQQIERKGQIPIVVCVQIQQPHGGFVVGTPCC
jgi:hypothetical protein